MSVTTVPIQPIKKGSIAKYWVGISAVILAGGALAWLGTGSIRSDFATEQQFLAKNADEEGITTSKSGLQMQIIKGGEGASPTDDDVALVGYKGTLRNGKVFDENQQAPMDVARTVPGFSEALKKMQRGGKYKIWIPSKLGYGDKDNTNPQTGEVVIPANSTLIFEVELLDFRSRAELEAAQQEMEKQQRAQGGAPGGPPGTGAMPQGGGQQQLPPEIQAQIEQQMRQKQGM